MRHLRILLVLIFCVPIYGAKDFNGSNDAVNIGTLGTFGSGRGTGYSVSFWMRTTTSASTVYPIGMVENAGTTTQWFGFEINNPNATYNNIRIVERDNTSTALWLIAYPSSAVTFKDGRWHHFAYTVNPPVNVIKFWIDGVSVPVTNQLAETGATWANYTDPVYVGARDNQGIADQFADIDMEDLRIYSTILTADQVTSLYAGDNIVTNLVIHHTFRDPSNTQFIDRAGGAFIGNCTNCPDTLNDGPPNIYTPPMLVYQ